MKEVSQPQEIQILTGIQHVRHRPGMYISDVSSPKTLVKELVDNAVDEALNGHASKIEIETNGKDGWYRVRDNGRGLPLYLMEGGQIAARMLFTHLFSGGKFDHKNYNISSGLHGLGMTICNALSSKTLCQVSTNDSLYVLELSRGEVTNEEFKKPIKTWWKTEITIYPDNLIFSSVKAIVSEMSLKLVKLLKGDKIDITLNGTLIKPFSFRDEIDSNIIDDQILKVFVTHGTLTVELSFAWSIKEFNSTFKGAVNVSPCSDGWHIREAGYAVGRAIKEIDGNISIQDSFFGLRAFCNVLTAEPVFSSQTKEKLSWVGDKDAKGIWELVTKSILKKYRDSDVIAKVIRKITEYKKSIQKLSESGFVSSVVRLGSDKRTRSGVTGIYDCTTHARRLAELFIVEGKSAAGNLVQKRDKQYQAILPLRGKSLNAVSAKDIKKILSNREMVAMINGIGVGLTPNVDIGSARYGRIIIATDGDSDGAHIASLIIGAMAYLCPELIEAGMLYIVESPLYKQSGKFIYDDSLLVRTKKFDRFKGLGSMNVDDVSVSLLNPTSRRLVKLTLEECRERVLDMLLIPSEKKRIMLDSGKLIEDI